MPHRKALNFTAFEIVSALNIPGLNGFSLRSKLLQLNLRITIAG